jgi:hypothetical protein
MYFVPIQGRIQPIDLEIPLTAAVPFNIDHSQEVMDLPSPTIPVHLITLCCCVPRDLCSMWCKGTVPYSSCFSENWRAESAVRHIQTLSRTLQAAPCLPSTLRWSRMSLFFILNKRISARGLILLKSSTRSTVNLELFPELGSKVEYRIGNVRMSSKFSSRTATGVFVGTANNSSVSQMTSYPYPAIRV